MSRKNPGAKRRQGQPPPANDKSPPMSRGAKKNAKTPGNSGDGLVLSTKFEIVGDDDDRRLVMSYSVENQGPNDAYLLNRIPRQLPRFEVKPDNIYIHFEDTTVHLLKQIPEIPPGLNPTEPVAPFVTALRAGTTFSEKVTMPLPLREHREYVANDSDPDGPVLTYNQVYFTLGYMIKLEGTKEREEEIQGVKVLLFTNPPGALSRAGHLNSPRTALAIPVRP